MDSRLLERLKRLHMLKYIQLQESITIETEGGVIKTLPKETILPVMHKNLGKRYYTVDTESLHVIYEDDRFVITEGIRYRWLTHSEAMLYQQPVMVTHSFKMMPLEISKYTYEPKEARIGSILYIDGFTFDSLKNTYLPYTNQNNTKYEIDWDKFIPSIVFESLFKQSHNSCLPLLSKQKLIK